MKLGVVLGLAVLATPLAAQTPTAAYVDSVFRQKLATQAKGHVDLNPAVTSYRYRWTLCVETKEGTTLKPLVCRGRYSGWTAYVPPDTAPPVSPPDSLVVTPVPPGAFTEAHYAAYPPRGTSSDTVFAGTPVSTRTVSQLNYSTAVLESVRWVGAFNVPVTGPVTFQLRTDDGTRVYVDGALIMDHFQPQSPTDYSRTVTLTGGDHTLRVDYYNNDASGIMRLTW